MTSKSFSATIQDWCAKIPEAQEEIFKKSCKELVRQLNQKITEMIYETPETPNYKRNGFLRASLMASTEAMPRLTRDNPGGQFAENFGDIILVINGAELGDTIYLGYTANYGARVHYGVHGYGMYGHVGAQAPRPWVTLVGQRWKEIVDSVVPKIREEFGL